MKLTEDEVKEAWNAGADEHNQWKVLGDDEQLSFVFEYVNNITKYRSKNDLISEIADGDFVLLNSLSNTKHVPEGMSLIYLPPEGVLEEASYYEDKAFLVPTKNVINKTKGGE